LIHARKKRWHFAGIASPLTALKMREFGIGGR